MSFVDTGKSVIVGVVMLLVLASVLTSLDSSLTAQLGNTAVHPNGALTLTLIALLLVGFAVAILLRVFEEEPPSFRQGFGQ